MSHYSIARLHVSRELITPNDAATPQPFSAIADLTFDDAIRLAQPHDLPGRPHERHHRLTEPLRGAD
jgi:hypothetical protein